MYGWTRKVLLVDLSSRKVSVEELAEELVHDFLGGRGLGARLLYQMVSKGIDPLGPENVLIFAVGPLTGTAAPASGRLSLSSKAPLTGTISDSNAGGSWGVRFKATGNDALVIKGRADKPLYLVLTEEGVLFEDASSLWGKDTFETTHLLLDQYGSGANVLCIGPAGERLVKFASILVDGKRSLGRGGLGAVMGSKNLKAIVVKGQKRTQVKNPELFDFVLYETHKQLKANPITSKALPQFGTAVLVNLFNEAGILPTRNFQTSSFEGARNLSGEAIAENILVRRDACHGCPIGCTRVTRTSRHEGHGPEYESVWALGADCGIADLEVVTEANYLCNKLGIDTISTGATIAAAMELSEKGILAEKLHFGDGMALLRLIPEIAYRQGLGDELAEGSRRFTEKHGAGYYAMHVKGLELPAYDPRGMKGQALGFATSNRGGCHLRGNMLGPEVLGSPKMIDRLASVGKAGLLINLQHSGAVLDSLVSCKFTSFALSDEYFARLLTAVTGVDFSAQDLQRIGERIWNLERLYNLREGFTRADDTLPARLLTEPVPDGPGQGEVVQLEPMLEEYYRFRSWDRNGVPTAKKIHDLGLQGLLEGN